MPRDSVFVRGPGNVARNKHSTPRRHLCFQPQVETLEARTVMTAGGKITGLVFNDAITNGVHDPSELALAGVTIFADSNGNGAVDAGEPSAQSGPDGSFALSFSQDGAVRLSEVEPLGFALTTVDPAPVTVAGGATVANINFGDRRTLAPDQSFVDQTFRDLLGRGADSGALDAFGTALDQGSVERPQILQAIQNSTEFRSRQIDSLFATLLHRNADVGGRQAFLAALANGATDEQIENTILASPEYFQNRGGGDNAGFATALYQDVLGRGIDSGALQNAKSFLAGGGSRLALTQLVQFSPEEDAHLVGALFQQLLRRDADPAALAAFTPARHGGATDEQIAEAIASSDEYFQRFCL
jgi:hypothetical protein